MISATHTHSAPSSFGALGTPADETYIPYLRERLVESLVQAESRMQPAKYGWGTADAGDFTAVRRWIFRPDRVQNDPFGNPTVRATMHAARNKDDVTGPSGPEDPELSMMAFQALDGQPIAVLANFSMHYFGESPISADYFGHFCNGLQEHLNRGDLRHPPVAILSHGCSGDIWKRDYETWNGKDSTTLETFTQGILEIAKDLHQTIEYRSGGALSMAESRLAIDYRTPDAQRLQWAQQIVDGLGENLPNDRVEVYAREQLILHEMQSTEIVVQGIQIGDMAIATTPCETYALTGLKIKRQSPLEKTMVIELANGADGYIPPPEQHHLGGYNTWAARSAGLDVQAEPRIVATAIGLLEQVTQLPRRPIKPSNGSASQRILNAKPLAYWRMNEMQLPMANDASGNGRHGLFELGTAFYLPGHRTTPFSDPAEINRSVHFAGGRMLSHLDDLTEDYSIVFSFWNGMPIDARETTGWIFSRDLPNTTTSTGDHLGLAGTKGESGHLTFQNGQSQPIFGKTKIDRWTWNRVALVRKQNRIQVFLNDFATPEIDCVADSVPISPNLFFGGRSDNQFNFEGRIDEIAVFGKAMPIELLFDQ